LAHWEGGSKGTVFLFPGRTEMVEKYGRAANDLAMRGFGTLAIDWRGQGMSDRAPKNRLIGHVGSFVEYQHDVSAMLTLARDLALPRPFHLLSHSMGGTIALRSLHEGALFAGAVFSAPMWGLLITPQMRRFAIGVSKLARVSGMAHRLTPTTNASAYLAAASFEGNPLTTDPEMFDWIKAQVLAHPELALAGPSLGWLSAALTECTTLARKPAPRTAGLIVVGSAERIIDPAPIHAAMAKWLHGQLDVYDGAEHEIMMETPALRERFFDAAANWFDTRS
jgi:lysophospholipase